MTIQTTNTGKEILKPFNDLQDYFMDANNVKEYVYQDNDSGSNKS